VADREVAGREPGESALSARRPRALRGRLVRARACLTRSPSDAEDERGSSRSRGTRLQGARSADLLASGQRPTSSPATRLPRDSTAGGRHSATRARKYAPGGKLRFELRGDRVRRRRIRSLSPEADSLLTSARASTRPTAWCHSTTRTLLNETETGTVALEHELVEVLVTDGEEIIAEAACLARIPGFPPCLGRFRSTW
jgi:hypothetical protein